MNKKRWIAVALSVLVFISSFVVSSKGKSKIIEKETTSLLKELMSEELSKTVLRPGNANQRIAVLHIRGTILNMEGNWLNASQYNHNLTINSLDSIRNDETVKGIIIRIDSPGGGVYESAQLSDKIAEIKRTRNIPVYVVMESMAASGGYYIAAGADQIYATEETLTGSIGVIMSGMNYSGLMDKLGVEDMTIKSGEMKDVGSLTRETTKKDLEVLQELVDNMYERFVDVVVEGRDMDRAKVYKLADGRIYDGAQAKNNGLVDKLGYYDEALADFEKAYGLQEAEVFSYDNMGLDKISQLFMKSANLFNPRKEINVGNIELPASWKESSGFMYIYGGY